MTIRVNRQATSRITTLADQRDKKWSRASFSIFSTTLSPEQISERLVLLPTKVHRKGEPQGFRKKDGSISRTVAWKDSFWNLTSPLGPERNLAEHIKWLLDAIEPKAEAITALRAECSLIRLFCGFASHNGQGGFSLDAASLARISKLGLSLDLDLYPPTDPEISEDEEKDPSKTAIQ
jgi:hypothetical protein